MVTVQIHHLLATSLVTAVARSAAPAADFDTCFLTNGVIRAQFAIEGLDIPEPGDNFVVTAQAFTADTGVAIDAIPGQIFNGAATQGTPPSVIIGTQQAEVNRVAGFLDFQSAQGATCVNGKPNIELRVLQYTQNGAAVPAQPAVPAAPAQPAVPANLQAAPAAAAAKIKKSKKAKSTSGGNAVPKQAGAAAATNL